MTKMPHVLGRGRFIHLLTHARLLPCVGKRERLDDNCPATPRRFGRQPSQGRGRVDAFLPRVNLAALLRPKLHATPAGLAGPRVRDPHGHEDKLHRMRACGHWSIGQQYVVGTRHDRQTYINFRILYAVPVHDT